MVSVRPPPVLLHQHFHVLPVHVIDILDQLIPAVQHGACGGDEPDQFLLRGADLAVCLQLDARAVIVTVVAGSVTVREEVLSL